MTQAIPRLKAPLALFLDVDGTLIELASRPDAVVVPPGLRALLEQAALQQDGALALVSGRSIETLDRLFAPSRFAASGRHGFERRSCNGTLTRGRVSATALDEARRRLCGYARSHAGVLLEDKGIALALHYRQAQDLEGEAHRLMQDLREALSPAFRLLHGKCMIELVASTYSKRSAIEEFMREAPFSSRTPVFIGDDVTDEDGFEAVNALGGYSVRVGTEERLSAAGYRIADVNHVIGWLRTLGTAGAPA